MRRERVGTTSKDSGSKAGVHRTRHSANKEQKVEQPLDNFQLRIASDELATLILDMAEKVSRLAGYIHRKLDKDDTHSDESLRRLDTWPDAGVKGNCQILVDG